MEDKKKDIRSLCASLNRENKQSVLAMANSLLFWQRRGGKAMRKSLALKTLFRSPVKTLLTFLLIVAASFALFSRVTDYAVTTRETKHARDFYHGVAALDNTVPDMIVDGETAVGDILFSSTYESEDKPWPTREQIQEFSSLPGVTLADTRYMTAGLVEGCKRVFDEVHEEYSGRNYFVLEGTYKGYQNYSENVLELMFDDITVLAGADKCEPYIGKSGQPTIIVQDGLEELQGDKNPHPEKFWRQLKEGSRVLVTGQSISVATALHAGIHSFDEKTFCILDGKGEGYLDTEEFTYYKELIEAINRDSDIYDMVYTSDMRAIPRFNERKMVVTEGRPLTAEDTDVCVVSELFLETYGKSIGDTVSVQLGDQLFSQDPLKGAQARGDLERASDFGDAVELEIVGVYRFNDTLGMRVSESAWSYSPSTIFVPGSLLSVEVPVAHEPSIGEYSVLIEDARDMEAFREAAVPLVAEMDVALCFSDGGWLEVKDSFEIGALTSLMTTVLYAAGAVLALFLAVYLYVGRNKEAYAIMRAMGVPCRMAGNTLVFPLAMLSVIAIPVGGAAGLFYTSRTAAGTLAAMTDHMPDGYAADATLPIGVILLCLFLELGFTALTALFFLQKMKKMSPLGLLQGETLGAGADTKILPDRIADTSVPVRTDLVKISAVDEMRSSSGRKYSAFRHVADYVLRHMRRDIWKSAVSLALTAVLAAGVGTLALARTAYRDAFHEVDVNVSVLDFASSAVVELSKSDLVEDFYCHNTFGVRINGMGLHTPVVFTNVPERYLEDKSGGYTAVYDDGYDISALNGTEPVCLLGKELAEMLDIGPGGEIALLSDSRYAVLSEAYKDESELRAAEEGEAVMYQVVGIVESGDAAANDSIFAGINGPVEELYSQPFPFGYCEFTLTDNGKVAKLDSLLTRLRDQYSMKYAPRASFYIDSEALKDVMRVRSLLEGLFPIAVMAALFLGLAGQALVILQSAREAAVLRILGVTKKRARCMLSLEQILLCTIGIVLVTAGLAWRSPGVFARSARTLLACYSLYFLGCLCGICAAAIQVTRHRVLELLQVKG